MKGLHINEISKEDMEFLVSVLDRMNLKYRIASDEEQAQAFNLLYTGAKKEKLGQYQQAIEDLSAAINLSEDDEIKGNAYFNRGLAKAELGQYKEAIEDFNQSIKLSEDDALKADAYFNIGLATRG